MEANNKSTLDAMNLTHNDKLEILINYDKVYIATMKKMIAEDRNVVNAINSLDIEMFRVINYNGKFNGSSLIEIFKNPDNIRVIQSIGIENLEVLLKSSQLCMNVLGRKEYSALVSRGIELILNDDRYYSIFEASTNLNIFDQIDFKKLQMIVESDLVDHPSIKEIAKHADSINLLNIDKLELFCNVKKGYTTLVSRTPGNWTTYSDWFGHLDIVIYRKFYICLLLSVLKSPQVIPLINSMKNEKLFLVLNSVKGSTEMYGLSALLKKPSFCKGISSIDIGKLEVLINEYGYLSRHVNDIYCEKFAHFVNLMNRDKLITSLKMLEVEDIIYLSTCYVADVRINVDLVIALYKAGQIDRVNRDLLHNKKMVEDKLTELFPEKCPVDQLLKPSAIINDGRVPNLKYLCLEAAALDLINQQSDESPA